MDYDGLMERYGERMLTELGIDVPSWIEQDIDAYTVEAILQGGCASGAYMPAVTYHVAVATMAEHGDEVTTMCLGSRDITHSVRWLKETWAGLACKVLSTAVEMWAHELDASNEILEAMQEQAEQDAQAHAVPSLEPSARPTEHTNEEIR